MTRPGRSSRWVPGNRFELLENGEAFFPRVFEAIAAAKREVLLETFILFDDKIGRGLHAALLQAARNGAEVHVLVDGFGSPDLSDAFVGPLVAAGVRFRIFDPGGLRIFGQRLNLLRRMHRKIVVVDGEVGFIGGINYSADHVADFGPEAKQDYSVEVRGPIVAQMRAFARSVVDKGARKDGRRANPQATSSAEPEAGAGTARAGGAARAPVPAGTPADGPRAAAERRRWPFGARAAVERHPAAGHADAIFVTRDNHAHTNDIERHYRVALRAARERVVIANAYFFPGYRFIREMRRAARRGVDVRLILQGQPDMPIVRVAASMLYDHLIRGGVRIYEYCDRPLHGKVALVDGEWSTVGSSNLDPLSLSLNLEANVVIRDREFNATLHGRLAHLMEHSCRQVEPTPPGRWDGLRLLRSYCLFHLMRWFPAWAGWLPRHEPEISLVQPDAHGGDHGHRPSTT